MTLSPLLLEGRAVPATITKSVLLVDDPDNPSDVLVMVLDPPRHGRLTRLHGDRMLSRFKLEELSQEQIQYVHDGSEGTQDSLVLQVNDGHSYQNILLQVDIHQKVGWTEIRRLGYFYSYCDALAASANLTYIHSLSRTSCILCSFMWFSSLNTSFNSLTSAFITLIYPDASTRCRLRPWK